ncbi:hypothetical protein B0J12DRAFT_295592 [Macrophomina phaseolina]|uniref:Uncharacterized protein n=1 Tax=Macrophomina phaseolina TaxID=35725 RepID=A0ABQ8GRY7_9PEZI|nr:hypothetical protein B0J12DRAFT_295592 [Macrophomina phaseolina]
MEGEDLLRAGQALSRDDALSRPARRKAHEGARLPGAADQRAGRGAASRGGCGRCSAGHPGCLSSQRAEISQTGACPTPRSRLPARRPGAAKRASPGCHWPAGARLKRRLSALRIGSAPLQHIYGLCAWQMSEVLAVDSRCTWPARAAKEMRAAAVVVVVVVVGEVRSRWSALALRPAQHQRPRPACGVRRLRLSSQPHSGSCHASILQPIQCSGSLVCGESGSLVPAATWAASSGPNRLFSAQRPRCCVQLPCEVRLLPASCTAVMGAAPCALFEVHGAALVVVRPGQIDARNMWRGPDRAHIGLEPRPGSRRSWRRVQTETRDELISPLLCIIVAILLPSSSAHSNSKAVGPLPPARQYINARRPRPLAAPRQYSSSTRSGVPSSHGSTCYRLPLPPSSARATRPAT